MVVDLCGNCGGEVYLCYICRRGKRWTEIRFCPVCDDVEKSKVSSLFVPLHGSMAVFPVKLNWQELSRFGCDPETMLALDFIMVTDLCDEWRK